MWSSSHTGDVGKHALVGDVGEIVERWQAKLDNEVSNANHQTSRNHVECTCGEHPLLQDRNSLKIRTQLAQPLWKKNSEKLGY